MSILKAITIAAAARTIERLQLHGKRGKIHAIFEGRPHVLRKMTPGEKNQGRRKIIYKTFTFLTV